MVVNRKKKRVTIQQKWQTCGVEFQGIEVRCDDTGLRGCYTTSSHAENSIAIRVPEKEALIEYMMDPLPAPDGIDKSSWRTVGSFGRLAFQLLMRPDGSEILSTLPRYPDDVDLPVRWSPTSLKELSRLCASASHRVSEEKRRWENALKVVKCTLSKSGFSDNDYFTALHAIRTRAFECTRYRFDRQSFCTFTLLTICVWSCWMYIWKLLFGNINLRFVWLPACLSQFFFSGEWLDWQRRSFYAFIPGLDMLNHTSSGSNVTLGFDDSTCQFVVRCKCDMKEDCELRFQYADASNDELLFTYGFIEKENPKDVLEIALKSLSELCDVSDQVESLQKRGFDRIRFERNGVIGPKYVKAIGLDSIGVIARKLQKHIEKSLGKSHALLECYKREKLRILDEFLEKRIDCPVAASAS